MSSESKGRNVNGEKVVQLMLVSGAALLKEQAKKKFDVYPSAYANGWAAKNYKGKGGTWRKC